MFLEISKIKKHFGEGESRVEVLKGIDVRKDGKGMERKRTIKNGRIIVRNPLYQELPKHEGITKSGRTCYRFTGSYDGKYSLPSKVLRLMERENSQKEVDKKDGRR